MTVDLIARAEARISSLTSQAVALDAQAMDIRDRAMDCRLGIQELRQFITLARELADEPEQETRPNTTDGQAAEYAVVTPATAERVTAEETPSSSAPYSPEVATQEGGGFPVAAAPQNSGATGGDEGDQTSQPESVVGISDAAEPPEQSDSHPAAPEEAPALSKRQQVRITHEDHPDWSAAQIADHLGLTRGSVSGHASSLGIKFSGGAAVNPDASSITKLDRVRLMHEQHPTWTARMIAQALGEKESSVSTLLATVRKEVREQPKPEPEFASERAMVEHYGDVAARLGKAK